MATPLGEAALAQSRDVMLRSSPNIDAQYLKALREFYEDAKRAMRLEEADE